MSAFNYRDLLRQVRNQYWEFYFQARKIELPEGATWSQPEKDVQASMQKGFEALDEGKLTSVYAELRRVKCMATVRGCWRRLKTDHPCRMKIDQGLLLA
ncbi:MAG: hypothetical protein EBW73_11455 [Betaproteobacteria bacterium]|nr:hypothetical protein [Betaproteobacteria bacterium]